MAFCKGGFSKVKDFMHKVTNALTTVMEDITKVTGVIKAIEGNPTVEAIVAAIPLGTQIEKWIDEGLATLVSIDQAGLSLAEKITAWLEGQTPDAKDGMLLKLASKATAIADDNTHPQSFYDTAVQVHIEGLK